MLLAKPVILLLLAIRQRKCFADKKNVMWTCTDSARRCQEKKRKTFAQAEELVEMCVAVVAP